MAAMILVSFPFRLFWLLAFLLCTAGPCVASIGVESAETPAFSQVAEHTGFGTAGYFIKAFKKKVSLTPNEYKKSLKKLGK